MKKKQREKKETNKKMQFRNIRIVERLHRAIIHNSSTTIEKQNEEEEDDKEISIF